VAAVSCEEQGKIKKIVTALRSQPPAEIGVVGKRPEIVSPGRLAGGLSRAVASEFWLSDGTLPARHTYFSVHEWHCD
jgi:hypothetical protein